MKKIKENILGEFVNNKLIEDAKTVNTDFSKFSGKSFERVYYINNLEDITAICCDEFVVDTARREKETFYFNHTSCRFVISKNLSLSLDDFKKIIDFEEKAYDCITVQLFNTFEEFEKLLKYAFLNCRKPITTLVDIKREDSDILKAIEIINHYENNISYTKWLYGHLYKHWDKYEILKNHLKENIPIVVTGCYKRLCKRFGLEARDIAVAPVLAKIFHVTGCCLNVWNSKGRRIQGNMTDIFDINTCKYFKEEVDNYNLQRIANYFSRDDMIRKLRNKEINLPQTVLDSIERFLEHKA